MTQENCKQAIYTLLKNSELNTIIDNLITSHDVGNMLNDTSIEDFTPRAVLAVAIRKEYERFKPISDIGISIEESIRRALSM